MAGVDESAIVKNSEGVRSVEYPGGKGNLYQQIINMIPPHRVYIETHLGGGAIMRHKRPARQNIGIDLDRDALEQVRYRIVKNGDSVCSEWIYWNGGPSYPPLTRFLVSF